MVRPNHAEPLHRSPVRIAAAELGNRQSRMKPHGVMPGRLFCVLTRDRATPSRSVFSVNARPSAGAVLTSHLTLSLPLGPESAPVFRGIGRKIMGGHA